MTHASSHESPFSATGAAGEQALLVRVSQGDRDALRKLYFLFHRRLSRFLLRLTHRPEITEEIINDTMLVVWQHAHEFRGDSRPSTWILGIAYRRALKALSRERPSQGNPQDEESSGAPDAEVMEGLACGVELSDWLDRALERLTPEHRLVIELAYVLGLSCEEIASIAGCPVNTVKTRMFYARLRLRELLARLAAPSVAERLPP